MDNISMIAAIGKNRELGKDNKLIWNIKEDMSFFKETTINKPVVMGRNTYKSLKKPLKDRKNIILTTRAIEIDDNIVVMRSIENLLKYIEQYQSIQDCCGRFWLRHFENLCRRIMEMPTEDELEKEESIERIANLACEKENLEEKDEKAKELLGEYQKLSSIKGKNVGDE